MALNESDKYWVMQGIEDAEFPAVVVFRTSGPYARSSWEPEIVADADALAEYIGADDCPEWDGFDQGYVELVSAREFFGGEVAPAFRPYVEGLVENIECCEGLRHMDAYDFLSGEGWEYERAGWVPEDRDGYDVG